ncbi:MAG: hypothetical protein ABUL42_03820 [Terricaulis silvestris]
MRIAAPSMSHHRLQRIHRWAMLWLTGFAAFLEAAASFAPISEAAHAIAHNWLARIERMIVCLVIIRAGPRLRSIHQRKGVSEHRRIETAMFRAIIGCRLRRALLSKDLQKRIAALRLDLNVLVAHVLRRIPCGLTRRRPIKMRPEPRRVEAPCIFMPPAPCADTS